jgi:hypothetical protein
MKISTAIYLYGFLNQNLGLILGNILFDAIVGQVAPWCQSSHHQIHEDVF